MREYQIGTDSHVVSGTEAGASHVVLFGENKASLALAAGEAFSPREDRMILFDVRCDIQAGAAGNLVLGRRIQFVTLTGARGREWLRFLGDGVQTAFHVPQMRGFIPVRYGLGVLLLGGGWDGAEELRMRWTYVRW